MNENFHPYSRKNSKKILPGIILKKIKRPLSNKQNTS